MRATASITVRRHTSSPFPLEMRLRLADGSVENVTIPVDIWGAGAERVTAEVAVRSNVVGARLWPRARVFVVLNTEPNRRASTARSGRIRYPATRPGCTSG